MIDRNSFVPIYHQVAAIIRDQICSGQIQPGDKLPSESEMIAHYKIGRLTVREALKLLVNDGYVEKVQGKGTFCKSFPEKKMNINIDVLLDMSDTYFIPNYVKSISEGLTKNNANFIIGDTKDSDMEICSLIAKIIEKGSSGVILQPSHGLECTYTKISESFRSLRDAGIPYIMIDSYYENINASYLVVDEIKGGRMAYDYLDKLNHKNIAVVYVGKFKDSMLRLNGFVKRAKMLGKDKEKNITLIDIDKEFDNSIKRMMSGSNAPTALFCYNDETAINCMKKLRELNVNVPEDVSILGFDDSLIAQNAVPPLSTIAHPKGIMGEYAVNALFDLINGKVNWPYIKIFKPVLVERDSCKVL